MIKRVIKYIACLLILLILMTCFQDVCFKKTVQAAGMTLQDLQAKFPHGTYWNHVVQSGHYYNSNYEDIGPCNNPDGYTLHPCNTHTGNAGIGGYDCNSFLNGLQCAGFARKLAYDVYGSNCTSWGRTSKANVKPGDVIHYYGADADAASGHWVMVIGKSGSVVTVGECNFLNNPCMISWGRQLDLNNVSSNTVYYSAPYQLPVSVTPSTIDYSVQSTSVTDITDNNAIMRGHINTSGAISSGMFVGVYVGLSPDNFTMGHLEEISQAAYNLTGKGGFDFWFDLNKETSIRLAAGQKYYYKFCVKYNGVEKCTDVYSFETADYEKPVISNVKISDINETGYTVSCTITDNAGISKVQFPTWTIANNQDDLLWGAPTSVKDSTYTYRVNISDHNGEYGSYVTHIYAYDNRGNYGKAELDVVNIYKKLSVTANISASAITEGEKVTISAKAEGGKGSYLYTYRLYNKNTNQWTYLAYLRSDKTFIWTPEKAGDYDIFVEIKDENGNTALSRAKNLKVSAPALSIVGKGSVSTVTKGGKVSISAEARGGSGNYTYSYLIHNTDTNAWSRLTSNFVTNNTFTWTAGSIGNREFFVEVKDSTGKIVRSNAVNVKVTAEPLTITAKSNMSSVMKNGKVTITGTAKGGSGNYTYSYLIHNTDTNAWSRLTPNFVTNNTFIWTAGSAGNREFFVEVKDSTGKVVRSSAVKVKATAALLSVTARANVNIVKKNGKVIISGTAAGGSGTYTYSYLVHNKDTNAWSRLTSSFISSSTYTWTAGSTGNREFFVEVKDSTGKVVRSSAVNVKTEETFPLAINAEVTSTQVSTGGKVVILGSASGGSGSYTYSYLVHNKDTNQWSRLTPNFMTANSYTWTAGSAGNREFFVEVKDNTGKVVRSKAVNVVTK